MMSNWSHEVQLSNIVLRIPDPNFLLKEQAKACSELFVIFFCPACMIAEGIHTNSIAYSCAVGHEGYHYRALNTCAGCLRIALSSHSQGRAREVKTLSLTTTFYRSTVSSLSLIFCANSGGHQTFFVLS